MKHHYSFVKLAIISLGTIGALVVTGVVPRRGQAQEATAVFENPYTPRIPAGIPTALWKGLIPADNAMTEEKVALGELLYFDKRLSADGTLSCAMCHEPASAFGNHRTVAVGINNQPGRRNVPTILNAMFSQQLFWDGRSSSLEEQAKVPLFSATEMGMTHPEQLVAKLAAVTDYRNRFRRVFGEQGITVDTVTKAIAAFERTLLAGNSAFDRFIAGDQKAMSEAQQRGWRLFRSKARCVACHAYTSSSPFFTDFKFHNTGIAVRRPDFTSVVGRLREVESPDGDLERALDELSEMDGFVELGRYIITRKERDIGAFKTPALRDVERTSPYMHDGSIATLDGVVRFYSENGHSYVDPGKGTQPLQLTEEEISCLVAFLRALTSDDVPGQKRTASARTQSSANLGP
jgi:cytochrome c peroxidase